MTIALVHARETPTAAAIRTLMRSGFDTLDIARLLHVDEATIWNVLAKS